MNYIKHLNGIFERFNADTRLNPSHISLYFALFREWNRQRFEEWFVTDRPDLMKTAGIKSKSTYHRCIGELNSWGYLNYSPSNNPYRKSRVGLTNNQSATGPTMGRPVPKNERNRPKNEPLPKDVIIINNNKTKTNKGKLPRSEKEVVDFFISKNWLQVEALKFFNHYQANGWKIGGKTEMMNWRAAARSWMLKAKEFKSYSEKNPKFQGKDNLKTIKIKSYDKPL